MSRPKYGLHILLFFLTFLTLTFQDTIFTIPFESSETIARVFSAQWPYSVSLLFIILCHEMGHYLAAKFYGIRSTLPYFLPVPFAPVGTMGAVIKIQEPIRNKVQLFDIGVWGPAMSLVLSIPCLWIGLKYSTLVSFAERTSVLLSNSDLVDIRFGNSVFVYFASQQILGPYDPNLFSVEYHPLAFAGWVGLLITALNLLPFGQLDGGHVIYSLVGEKYRRWIYYLFSAFLLLAIWNYSWIVWGLLIYYFIRVEHPYIPDGPSPLDKYRKIFGWSILLSLVLIFPISPITVVTSAGLQPSLGEELWHGLLNLLNR
ncbi:site-2 protease family protein [Leptospira langatensis]|uniref:Site-2 protease family protein n=1 Tax=Leptospira langatensis TaxID=2484983 RepID=A0A5F1ZVI1_9LEPT|nr:site-2 protease family protein [Leptospira langatensis]TGK03101.1 site-2 protease family protein [Leptospira langatensis]TGL41858.1 site-2 protease family protein [Leptospira langatensis]